MSSLQNLNLDGITKRDISIGLEKVAKEGRLVRVSLLFLCYMCTIITNFCQKLLILQLLLAERTNVSPESLMRIVQYSPNLRLLDITNNESIFNWHSANTLKENTSPNILSPVPMYNDLAELAVSHVKDGSYFGINRAPVVPATFCPSQPPPPLGNKRNVDFIKYVVCKFPCASLAVYFSIAVALELNFNLSTMIFIIYYFKPISDFDDPHSRDWYLYLKPSSSLPYLSIFNFVIQFFSDVLGIAGLEIDKISALEFLNVKEKKRSDGKNCMIFLFKVNRRSEISMRNEPIDIRKRFRVKYIRELGKLSGLLNLQASNKFTHILT
uniref:LRR domain containing protein n=1 Tax=Heterorhabditis bacteriophora TaxID=37862 RepID=A0A1I7W742_HETBA